MKLSIKEAERLTGISEAIIKEWIGTGKLDHSRTDNFIWINTDGLRAAIDQDRREAAAKMFNKWVNVYH